MTVSNMRRRQLIVGGGAALGSMALVSRAEAADGPVRLGMLLDLNSVYADNAGRGSETAARMAIEDFGGTVLGRPVELLVADHQNKSDIAAALSRRWFDQDGVQAILEVVASAPTISAISAAKQFNKLVFSNGAGSSSLTNEDCDPHFVQYTYTSRAFAQTVGKALTARGALSWYFLTLDTTFGIQLVADTAAVVKGAGGTVLGSVKVPTGTTDFSSLLIQAQSSGADVVGLTVAGVDAVNALKQAHEFGLMRGKQQVAGLIVSVNDIDAVGLEVAQGLLLADPFYWNHDETTRAFAKRYYSKVKKMPTYVQAGSYSSTLTYLKAVKAAGTVETDPVVQQLRTRRIDDAFTRNGHIRKSGLMVHDMHLFRVKKPPESKEPWDFYDLVTTLPGEDVFGPEAQSKCRL